MSTIDTSFRDVTPLRGTYACLAMDDAGRRAAARIGGKELAYAADHGRARVRQWSQDRVLLHALASRYGAAAGTSRDVTTANPVRNSTRKEH